jgi:hypothetical protein
LKSLSLGPGVPATKEGYTQTAGKVKGVLKDFCKFLFLGLNWVKTIRLGQDDMEALEGSGGPDVEDPMFIIRR